VAALPGAIPWRLKLKNPKGGGTGQGRARRSQGGGARTLTEWRRDPLASNFPRWTIRNGQWEARFFVIGWKIAARDKLDVVGPDHNEVLDK
jgi:hypothetical protein